MCVCAQVDRLWQLLCPLIRTALTNITVETYKDWGTCIATACVSRSHAYKYTTHTSAQGSGKKNGEFMCVFNIENVEDQIFKKSIKQTFGWKLDFENTIFSTNVLCFKFFVIFMLLAWLSLSTSLIQTEIIQQLLN